MAWTEAIGWRDQFLIADFGLRIAEQLFGCGMMGTPRFETALQLRNPQWTGVALSVLLCKGLRKAFHRASKNETPLEKCVSQLIAQQ